MATTAQQLADTSAGRHWQAGIELTFERIGVRSALVARRHFGPLRVQRPFYPEGGEVCHVYLLHPPGGVVGGDALTIDITARANAHVLATTPAAAKFYRSDGRASAQTQHLYLDDNATLEWLPQESIVFRNALAFNTTRVMLGLDAKFAGWDIVCFGRPASGERFDAGEYTSRFEIYRNGAPLFLERPRFRGQGAEMLASWGLAGYCVHATFVVTGRHDQAVQRVREAVGVEAGAESFAVSQLRDALVCRYLGQHVERAKTCFLQAWQIARPLMLGRQACQPRIWAT